jgi:hypothetical protein
MDKAVQVGLVFPRSGQQVLVQLPTAHAERLGVHHDDGHTSTPTLMHPNRTQQTHDTSQRTQ